MKKITLLFIGACISSIAFAQVGQRTAKLYNVTIKASDVLGTKHAVWGPIRPGDGLTEPLSPPSVTDYLYSVIGSWYSRKDFYTTHSFLNDEIDDNSLYLDSINFSFYKKYGFLKLEASNNNLLNDAGYLSLKDAFRNPKLNNQQRRDILYSPNNRAYLNALESSRFTINDVQMTNTTNFSNDLQIGLGAEIAAKISSAFNLDANATAMVKDAVVKTIRMSDAHYYEIYLDDDFLVIASKLLNNGFKNPSTFNDDEDFVAQFKKFKNDTVNNAVIYGVACIKATFSISKSKDINATIGAIVSANLDSTKIKDIAKITANVTANYIGGKNVDGTVNATSFYNLRYAYTDAFNK